MICSSVYVQLKYYSRVEKNHVPPLYFERSYAVYMCYFNRTIKYISRRILFMNMQLDY